MMAIFRGFNSESIALKYASFAAQKTITPSLISIPREKQKSLTGFNTVGQYPAVGFDADVFDLKRSGRTACGVMLLNK